MRERLVAADLVPAGLVDFCAFDASGSVAFLAFLDFTSFCSSDFDVGFFCLDSVALSCALVRAILGCEIWVSQLYRGCAVEK